MISKKGWLVSAVLLPLAVLAADKPFFGISVTMPSAALRHHLALAPQQGLLVATVHPDSPAAKAGIEKHDVLLEIDGKSVGSEAQLMAAMAKLKAGAKVNCWIVQRGKHQAVEVTLGARPTDGSAAVSSRQDAIVFELPLLLQQGQGQLGSSVRTMVVHDGVFAIEARQINGGLKVVVRDNTGKTIFDGSVDSATDVEKLPPRVKEKLQHNDFLPQAVPSKPTE